MTERANDVALAPPAASAPPSPNSRGGHGEPADDHGFDAKEAELRVAPVPTRAIAIAALFGLLFVAALFVLGFVPRKRRLQELGGTEAGPPAPVTVSVASPRHSATVTPLVLPGTVRPYQETAIYARASGYLKRYLAEFGDTVKQGQLLAEIEVPEVDQQIDQARASLNQLKARLALANANVVLAESTLKRYMTAAPAGGITPQELDEKHAGVEVAKATTAAAQADVEAGEANVRRLNQLREFANVTAPFAGTITARWVEVGTLITAGNAKGQELFHLVQTNPARVFVRVPQSSAAAIKIGETADVVILEQSERKFPGKVVRTSGSIDDSSKTLLADVEVPNESGALLSGMYAQVRFQLPQERTTWFVPQSALVTTADGTQVAVVGSGDRLHFQTVAVDTDYGSEVSVSSGVSANDRVVTNPGEKTVEGLVVQVAAPPPTEAPKK